MVNSAIATRISSLDGDKFKHQIDILRNKKPNHEENLKRFGKK